MLKQEYIMPALIGLIVGGFAILGFSEYVLNRGGGVTSQTKMILLDRSEEIAELATLRETYTTLVSSATDMPVGVQQIWGTDVSMFATGQVVVGVSLSNLRTQDIQELDDGRLEISMPQPTYLDCYLLENSTVTLSRREGWFGSTNREIEGEARRYALRTIIENSFREGALQLAQERAKDTIENLIAISSAEQIELVFVDAETPTALTEVQLPQSCQLQ